MSDSPYFEKHVFFCLNQRDDGRPCCQARGAQIAQQHAKKTDEGAGHERARQNPH